MAWSETTIPHRFDKTGGIIIVTEKVSGNIIMRRGFSSNGRIIRHRTYIGSVRCGKSTKM
jgi:hypothetical protein